MNENIVRKALNGDTDALVELFEQEQHILYKTAYAYVKNEQDALDLMQDLFELALRKIHTVKEPKYVRTWLVRCLINLAINLMRKNKKWQEQEQKIDDRFMMKSNEAIIEMLNVLPESEQQLVYLRFFQSYKNKEIAAVTKLPEGTVKSKMNRILKKLRVTAGEREDWHV